MLDRIPRRGASRLDAELRVNGSKVRIDRPGADAELFRELPIGQAARHAAEDLDLAGGEAICPRPSRHYCVPLDNVRLCVTLRLLLLIITVR